MASFATAKNPCKRSSRVLLFLKSFHQAFSGQHPQTPVLENGGWITCPVEDSHRSDKRVLRIRSRQDLDRHPHFPDPPVKLILNSADGSSSLRQPFQSLTKRWKFLHHPPDEETDNCNFLSILRHPYWCRPCPN